MKKRDEKIELLRGVALFNSCDDKELQQIAQLVDEARVPEGKEIITEGSTNGREAFIILEGTASVSVNGVQVAVIGPGGITGEMAVIDHERRCATVTALSDLRVLVVDARGLHALVEKHGVGWKLMKEIGLRVRSLDAEVAATGS